MRVKGRKTVKKGLPFAFALVVLCALAGWHFAPPRIEMERDVYPAGTQEITGVWRAAPWRSFSIGEAWCLERMEADGWMAISGPDKLRHDIGLTARAGTRRAYSLAGFASLKPGRYRVCVDALEGGGRSVLVTGEFSLE